MGALIRSSTSSESLRPIFRGKKKALAAGQRRRHGAPFVGPPWAWWSRRQARARVMSTGCPGLCHALPGTEEGRRRVLPGLSSPVDVDGGGGDFVSVVVLVEAQTAASMELRGSELHARSPSLRRHGLPSNGVPAVAFIACPAPDP